MSLRLITFAVKFLLLGAFFIVSNYDLALSNNDDRSEFFNVYFGWVTEVTTNAVSLTGQVINVDWLPDPNEFTQKDKIG